MLNFVAPCNHRDGHFKCLSLEKNTLIKARRIFFAVSNKVEQDRRLALLMKASEPKRRRCRGPTRLRTATSMTVSYYLRSSGKDVRVCSKFFGTVFSIAQSRMNKIAKCVKIGEVPCERRGGDHKINLFSNKRQEVIQFISRLRASESHYSRNKTQRLYLPSTLSIAALLKLYNSSVSPELKVKRWFFERIFTTKFNLGFGSPAVDACSYCLQTKHKIREATNVNEKNKLLAFLGAHKLRAKTFHKLMKRQPVGSVTFSFDLQQVQPLPKLSIGEAFYSRQISFYSFCVTDINGEHPVFYQWAENQAARGAVEVSSALCDFLEKYSLTDENTIRLFCDGCGGQNKNAHVVHALALWLHKKTANNLKYIQLYFPVRGHSYLPPDRLFGRVEKKIRKYEEIVLPEEYQKIYSEVGEVRVLGSDWLIRDYKNLCNFFKKTDGISDMKRVLLKKVANGVALKMENTYQNDDPSKAYVSLLKRGKKMDNVVTPPVIPLYSKVSEAKKSDVTNLLNKRFGEEWKNDRKFQFYLNIQNMDLPATATSAEDEFMCDCMEEEQELMHV